MPYVNIKVTGGSEAPNAEQKAKLIHGVTELLARVLNKNPHTTVVVIDEVDMELGYRGREHYRAPRQIEKIRISAPCREWIASYRLASA